MPGARQRCSTHSQRSRCAPVLACRVADPPARATSPHRASCLALERLARRCPADFSGGSWGRFPLNSRPDGRNGFGTRAADLNKVSLNRSTRFVVCFYHADFLANAECVQSRNHAFCLVSGGPSLSQPEGKKKEKVSPVACILSLSLCVCVCVCALCSVHCSLHKYMLMMII